jgi:threonine dehydratase
MVDVPTRNDIAAARERIRSYVRITPVLDVVVPTPTGERRVVFKLECLQETGSFKPRGAFNSLLQTKSSTIVACSGGNHGLAVAFAAHRLGKRAVIVVPKSAALNKVEAMRVLHAEVHLEGDVPSEAFLLAEKLSVEHDWPLIHPYDQFNTVAGAGTHGLELREQAPDVSHWLIAVGGGGFLAGNALALDGSNSVAVAVEPQGCPGLFEAQRNGGPIAVPASGAARTSLGAPALGEIAWEAVRDRVGPCTLVTEDAIVQAQAWLWKSVRLATEPGGATALAALRSGAWAPPAGASIGVVLCGANTDTLPA